MTPNELVPLTEAELEYEFRELDEGERCFHYSLVPRLLINVRTFTARLAEVERFIGDEKGVARIIGGYISGTQWQYGLDDDIARAVIHKLRKQLEDTCPKS